MDKVGGSDPLYAQFDPLEQTDSIDPAKIRFNVLKSSLHCALKHSGDNLLHSLYGKAPNYETCVDSCEAYAIWCSLCAFVH